MEIKDYWALVGLCLGLASCGAEYLTTDEDTATSEEQRLEAEVDVREAVFRYLFEANDSVQQEQAGTYYLQVEGGEDPPPQLLLRFEGHHPPVGPGSASTMGEYGIIDKATGRSGLILRIKSLRWVSDNEVEVEGGYYEGILSASGSTFRVVYEDGRWVVKSALRRWIS